MSHSLVRWAVTDRRLPIQILAVTDSIREIIRLVLEDFFQFEYLSLRFFFALTQSAFNFSEVSPFN
jgi:hypothetical protein